MSQSADDPSHLSTVETALRRWLDSGRNAARDVLATIDPIALIRVTETFPASQVRDLSSTRFGIPAAHRGDVELASNKDQAIAQLAARYGYRCCYCGRRLLSPVVVAILGLAFEDDGLWPTHWNFTSCHPVILPNFPALEHVWPIAREGHKTALENLALACWRCNATKGNRFPEELGWEPRYQAPDGADGLVAVARQIWAQGDLTPRDLGGSPRPWPSARTIQTWLRIYL